MKAVTEAIFKEDCEKHGITPWDFKSKEGPWRELYLKTRAHKKTGPKPNTTVRKVLICGYIQEKKKQNPKRKIYDDIIPEVTEELNAQFKLGKAEHPSLDREFTEGAITGAYEDVVGALSKMSNDIYNPKYKAKKKKSKHKPKIVKARR